MTEVSRRSVVISVVMGGGAVISAPDFVNVVTGETSSGNVEVEADATIPSGTSISLRVDENLDSDHRAENVQVVDLNDGIQTYEYDGLTGSEGSGVEYWATVEMRPNGDRSQTPELHSMTITLPSTAPEDGDGGGGEGTGTREKQEVGGLWDNFLVWTAVVVGLMGATGMASKSMAVAMMGAFMTFSLIAVSTGNALLENVLYVTLVLIFVGFAFKLWRLEGGGE